MFLIALITVTLNPGDLVLCGTPIQHSGIETPILQPGDIVACYADEVGEVSCTMVDDAMMD